MTGSIYYVNDHGAEGHYFPVKLSRNLFGTLLHVGGRPAAKSGFTAGDDFTPTITDPYLTVRIERCTDGNAVSVYNAKTRAELFKLNFGSATLEPPVGQYALSVAPDENAKSDGAATVRQTKAKAVTSAKKAKSTK